MALWGGRFEGEVGELMRRFNDSLGFDWRMYGVDIQGSVAYAGALARAGLISKHECEQLVEGLEQVRAEFEAGSVQAQADDEDIHSETYPPIPKILLSQADDEVIHSETYPPIPKILLSSAGDEDIHTAVERRRGELVGPVAGKLHTGRSRNDQVSTDLRLYLLREIESLEKDIYY